MQNAWAKRTSSHRTPVLRLCGPRLHRSGMKLHCHRAITRHRGDGSARRETKPVHSDHSTKACHVGTLGIASHRNVRSIQLRRVRRQAEMQSSHSTFGSPPESCSNRQLLFPTTNLGSSGLSMSRRPIDRGQVSCWFSATETWGSAGVFHPGPPHLR